MSADDRNWPIATLGAHVDLLVGFPFKSNQFTDRPVDIPLVKGSNIHQGCIDWQHAKRWPAGDADGYRKFELRPGDVVVAMDRPWIDAGLKWAWIRPGDPSSLLVQRVARLRGMDGLSTGFVRYLIGGPGFTDYIKPIVTGVTVPHISADQVRSFRFALPPICEQEKIAAVLSAYDDLIENNRRRIGILEAMAQRLYREWFVHFRYPGHEKARLVDSPLGKIPEGWEVVTIADAFEIVGGGTPSKRNGEYWTDGTINWYTPSDLTGAGRMFMDESSLKINELGLKRSSARLFPSRSVMMTSRATLGVISITRTAASTNQGFITCIPNEAFPAFYLYFWLRANTQTFVNMSSGATFKEISKSVFKTIKILNPKRLTVAAFEKTVRPMAEHIENLERRNTVLRQARDLLLPKLISGEVDVRALDIRTEAAP
ncbi:MAG: restriction endonuclease subunit S [Dehalococcoidia bacterium]